MMSQEDGLTPLPRSLEGQLLVEANAEKLRRVHAAAVRPRR